MAHNGKITRFVNLKLIIVHQAQCDIIERFGRPGVVKRNPTVFDITPGTAQIIIFPFFTI